MYLFQLIGEPCGRLNMQSLSKYRSLSSDINQYQYQPSYRYYRYLDWYGHRRLLPLATVWTPRPVCRARPLGAAKGGKQKQRNREEDEHSVIKPSQLGVPLCQKACLFAASVPLWHSSVIIPPCLDNIMKWRAWRRRRRPPFKFQVRCKQARGAQTLCGRGAWIVFGFFFTFLVFLAVQSKHNVCNNETPLNKGDTHTQLPAQPSRIISLRNTKIGQVGYFPRSVFTLRAWTSPPLCGSFPPFSTSHSLCVCGKSNLFVFNGRLSYSACIKVLSAALGGQRWPPHCGDRRRTWKQQGELHQSDDPQKVKKNPFFKNLK